MPHWKALLEGAVFAFGVAFLAAVGAWYSDPIHFNLTPEGLREMLQVAIPAGMGGLVAYFKNRYRPPEEKTRSTDK